MFNEKNEILQPSISTPYLDFDEIDKWTENNKDCFSSKSDLKKWREKYNLSDEKYAEVNHYIYENLLLLNTDEKIRFRVIFDLKNITNDLYPIEYYSVEKLKKYKYQLQNDIKDCIYDYLTAKQKAKLKEYKFFVGKLQSNLITCTK